LSLTPREKGGALAMRSKTSWTVGELAKRTGVSVRTLHYYDEIGLLTPSGRTRVGYRLYAARDLARLQNILSLRDLGVPLEEIARRLSDPDFSPLQLLETHLARIDERIAWCQTLRTRLAALASALRSMEEISVERFFQTMEVMTKMEKYYSPEQLQELADRRAALGDERIRRVESEWPELMAQVRAEMERGTDPADETVQRLAERWMTLVNEFTGGNPEIQKSLQTMYRGEDAVAGMEVAPMRELMDYVARAVAAKR
jgi:MerR family transcriptional regulator, thiopeptide resistance regulator